MADPIPFVTIPFEEYQKLKSVAESKGFKPEEPDAVLLRMVLDLFGQVATKLEADRNLIDGRLIAGHIRGFDENFIRQLWKILATKN